MADSSLISRLSDWSSISSPLAPLSTDQLDLLSDLGEVVKCRPRPLHLPPPQSTPQTDRLSSTASVSSMSDISHQATTTTQLFPAFSQLEGGSSSIDTGQQFLQWLHQVETSLVAEQSLPYQRFIRELERQLAVTSGLEKEVGDSLALLESLSTQYCMVSEKTTSLHLACQHLLEEQTKLAEVDRELGERLMVFQSADKVAHKLTSPTLSVQSETFLPLLSTIDTSMVYLLAHPNYRETPAYLTKFRACLTRALEMVRSHVKRVLETATSAASQQESPGAAQHQSAFTLFYGKFRAAAPRVRHLIAEAERRASSDLSEYITLVQDLQSNYLACRMELLQPSVKSAVAQLVTVHTRDHTGLVRAGCAFLLHVCEDEYQLHSLFFSEEEGEDDTRPQLGEFLERLCLVLYDNLRPLIIHVTHLETLAELTSILRNEVVGQHCVQHMQLTAFKRVATQMLADVQERLVYRTSVYIRSDIIGYSPAPGDLAYPEKLEMMEQIAESIQQEQVVRGHSRQNSTSSVVSATSMEVGTITGRTYSGNSPADLHGMWYPPVRRTLLTLSKLYRCLEKPIFTGLSQEVLSACLESVASAASIISDNPAKSRADGQLFEIKHLLILREQIAPFQVDFKVKETSLNFGKIRTAASTLLNHRSDILSLNGNNALLEFLLDSSPGVQEHSRDSKKDVDRRLKLTCEQFIADTSSNILSSVQNFNSRVSTFVAMRGDKSAKLSTQPWGDTNTTRSCVAETVRRIKQMVPLVQRKMQLYLANRETEFILFRPVRSNILSAFVNLLATLRAEYSFDDQTIIGCPTQEQLAALLASVMVVHVSNRSRAINSSSREVSESPELIARKMSTKSVKFQDSSEDPESVGDTIEEGKVTSEFASNGDLKESENETVTNGDCARAGLNGKVSSAEIV
eukprot:GFUD01004786.1.p1 GENE.GFUD01004786.1~~GFUD01004786.1.p1  ORF type:complete len:913 (+),score=335.84 GFUD01004786.1:66-2804(+)